MKRVKGLINRNTVVKIISGKEEEKNVTINTYFFERIYGIIYSHAKV